jgi:hypothetical protein
MGTEGQESAAGKHIDYRVEGRLPGGIGSEDLTERNIWPSAEVIFAERRPSRGSPPISTRRGVARSDVLRATAWQPKFWCVTWFGTEGTATSSSTPSPIAGATTLS